MTMRVPSNAEAAVGRARLLGAAQDKGPQLKCGGSVLQGCIACTEELNGASGRDVTAMASVCGRKVAARAL